MGMYAPETLPVLFGLAQGVRRLRPLVRLGADADLPNRAFAVAGTSLGYTDNSAHGVPAFNTPSVFGKLADAGQTWKIYGYSGRPLTASDFPDTVHPGPNGEVSLGLREVPSRRGQRAARGLLLHRAGVGDASPHGILPM